MRSQFEEKCQETADRILAGFNGHASSEIIRLVEVLAHELEGLRECLEAQERVPDEKLTLTIRGAEAPRETTVQEYRVMQLESAYDALFHAVGTWSGSVQLRQDDDALSAAERQLYAAFIEVQRWRL